MPTTQTMPQVATPDAAQAMPAEQARDSIRKPGRDLDRSNPPQAGPAARENRVGVGTTSSYSYAPRLERRSSGTGMSVEKTLVGLGFLIAVIQVVLFGLDLALAWPLGLHTPVAEAVLAGCGVILGYLSWDAYRALR